MATATPDFHTGFHLAARYPWREWTNGKQYEIRRGVDYYCLTTSLIVLIRYRAKREGLKVRIEHFDTEAIRFQFYGKQTVRQETPEPEPDQSIGWTVLIVDPSSTSFTESN